MTGKGEIVVRQGHPGPLMPSPFQFRKYGQSGIDVSEIFPQVATHVDELAVLRSVVSKSNDHVQAHYALASGMIRMGFPSVGSWVTYGLGSESQSLPAFVVIYDAHGGPFGGPSNWSAGLCRRPIRVRCFALPALRSWISLLLSPCRRTAQSARPAGKTESHRSREEPWQLRAFRSDRVLRTRVPDAGLCAGSGGCQPRIGCDEKAVRAE